VSAAEVSEGADIRSLKADFERINTLIASLLDPIQSAIGRFSPLLDLLWKVSDRPDDEVLNFSFRVAREQAWQQAVLLAGQLPEDRPATIQAFDRSAVLLARLVGDPGALLGRAVSIVRHTEQEDVPAVIDTLAEVTRPVA
ncbi:MAG: DUF5995 family protein, partial [Actinomycetota bacterium]|nr:DUF5995 family protein [Actinomycetota bacterium]